MPKVIIDGQVTEVPAGTLVVEAAKPLGAHIPVFCYHPKMQPVGMCRMCLVEVGTPKMDPATKQPVLDEQGNVVINWMPKMQAGCATIVSEGMAVRTNTAAVAEARRSVIEFLLTSHPLDCPICDKGGECPLQDHSLRYGPGKSRFYVESKFHNEKSVPLSPLIMLDRERCIQCGRCVRFQDEIVGEPVLGFADRGRGLEITTFDDPPFSSNYSGNTIDICPVGALTSRDFRFTARVFELNDHPSVCQQCSDGCNINIGERDNEIWISDRCRFVHHYANSPERLTTPMIRTETDLRPVSWYEALTFLANRLRPTLGEAGGKNVAGLAGDRVSNEDLYLFQKLLREVLSSPNVDHRVGWSQWNAGDELVKNFGAGVGTNLGDLTKGTTILVLGADPQNEQPVMRLRLSKASKQGATLIVANGRVTKLHQSAKQAAIYTYGAEANFLYGIVRAMVDANSHKTERVNGAEDFLSGLNLSAGEYAQRAGVTEDAVKRIAESFATAENGIIIFGRELMFAMQSDPAVEAALNALVVLSGHYGKKNNGVIGLYAHNNSMGAVDMGVTPNAKPGREATTAGMSAADMLSRAKVLFIMAADPARENPQFKNPGFMIVQDLFLTKTAKKADVVLPAASWAERDGSFTNTERRVQYFSRALEPMQNARADWEILRDIARSLGAGWNYETSSDVMNEITQTVPQYAKMSHSRLRVTARRRSSVMTVGGDSAEPVQIALGELFGDVSGLPWSTVSEKDADAKFDVSYVAPQEVTVEAGKPWLAVTRALLDRGSLIGYSEIVQPRIPVAEVEINSHDAEEWNIANGDMVKLALDIKPPRTLELVAHVDGQVPPGVVAVANNLDGTMNLPMGTRVQVAKV